MSEEQATASGGSGTLVTRLNRGWVLKMSAFIIGLIGLGAWGAYDGWYLFPMRGEAHSLFVKHEYLKRLTDSGMLLREGDIVDPAAEFESLRGNGTILADSIEGARRDWLLSLSRVRDLKKLTAENRKELDRRAAEPTSGHLDTVTLFSNPRDAFSQLDAAIKSKKMPAPLNAYDIPLQYFIVALGFGGGLWMLFFVARCSRIAYRYDPAARRLTLPDGRSFTSDQITDFDKRHWHKYYLYFTVEGFDGELKLDLLRFTPLEEWAEAMRRARPGYSPDEDEPKEKPQAEATEQPSEEAEDAPRA